MITFPCYENKHPKIKGWQNLQTPVLHKVEEPYGILCGKVNNIVVINCGKLKSDDAEKFVDGVLVWNELVQKHHYDCGSTLTVQTPSGGKHIYFQYSNSIVTGVAPLRDDIIGGDGAKKIKIDVLSDKRFVMGFDSPGYTVKSGSIEQLAEIPNWLLKFLDQRNQRTLEQLQTHQEKRKHDASDGETSKKITGESEISNADLCEVVLSLDDHLASTRDTWCKVIRGIDHTAPLNGNERLDIDDQFSQKAPEKYKGLDDVKCIYGECNGKTTWNSIKYLSEQHNKYALLEVHLRTRFPKLDVDEIVFVKLGESNCECIISFLTLTSKEEQKVVLVLDFLILLMLPKREFFGYMTDEIKAHGSLQFIDKRFTNNKQAVIKFNDDSIRFEQRSAGEANTNSEERAFFNFVNPYFPEKSFIQKENGQTILTKKLQTMLSAVISESSRRALEDQFGNIFNFTEMNVHETHAEKKNRKPNRPPKYFIDALQTECPQLKELYRSGRQNVVFECDQETNIWSSIEWFQVDSAIIALLEKYVTMTDEEVTAINGAFVSHLRGHFKNAIVDIKFLEMLDSNRTIFAFENCLLSLEQQQETYFRSIQWHDYVQTTCGWHYSKALSQQYMKDVENFFECVLPIASERECILTFFAKLLSGKRNNKHFLMLTDKRAGYNGKSTMMNLLRKVFGTYAVSGAKYVIESTTSKDRNSHDQGLFRLKAKRLLIVEELKKHMRLDCAWIKGVTGGEITVDGRIIGSPDVFEFILQTGIVIIFNEDDSPKFDVSDEPFLERMIVCPFRSKFVKHNNKETLLQKNTFVANENIVELFPKWRSATIDYLRTFFAKDITVPDSMLRWKEEICGIHDDVSCWLQKNTTRTNKDEDFISLRNIQKCLLKAQIKTWKNKQQLRGLLKQFARKNKLKYHAAIRPYINKKQLHLSDVVMGLRLSTIH